MKNTKLILGNSIEKLKNIESNSIDAVVTDPPYGLAFMGKKWDYDVPSVDLWREVFRVLKPGGHLLSFGGTRTYHRMVVNIEDAGFEIRDQIQWLYGSGFPKSYNVSKGIDKKFGTEGETLGVNPSSRPNSKTKGGKGFDAALGGEGAGIQVLKAPGHDLAKQWDGWGTALKPANEPIVVARKPLSEKNIVDNVLKWGTGAINIDGCRIPASAEDMGNWDRFKGAQNKNTIRKNMVDKKTANFTERVDNGINSQGRFPANTIFDEVAAEMLDEQSGQLSKRFSENAGNPGFAGGGSKFKTYKDGKNMGVSRFFYVAKASKRERNAGVETNNHPTVKPVKLMEYLIKLVTPPHGTVLDPFMGSGTTGVAAKNLEFNFVGIEREPEYYEIALKRIGVKEESKQIVEEISLKL